MGFFDIMKRAMGFSPADDDELEVEGIDATVTPLRQRALPAPAGNEDNSRETDGGDSQPDTDNSGDGSLRASEEGRPDASVIFEGVVGIFNEALPAFLRDSVDPEKQRQLLFDSLDKSVKDYFEHLEKNVERRLHSRYQAESRHLQEQIEELRRKARKEEEGNSNAKNLQLSAERQKRALSERVHELEKQLASIEAENEQYILENKSMANKLRMAALVDGDVEAGERIAEADRKVAEAEGQLAAAQEALKLSEERIAELTAAAATQATAEDTARVAELEKEVALLRDSLEQARAKDELSRVMVNDLNARAAEARRIAAEKEEQAASMQADLSGLNEQLALMTARLAKAQEDLQVVKEVQEQVVKLEESQRVNDAALRRQKDELMEKDELIRIKDADILTKNATLRIKDETIRRLEDQTDSLRKSVETAQFEKAQAESALRSEIERLKTLKGITPTVDTVVATPEVTVEIPVVADSVPDTPEIDLTLDLPELVTPQVETAAAPKPRRGRPPKPRQEGEAQPSRKKEEKARAREDADDNDFSLLDSTDWLIATPAPEPPKPKRQRKQKADSADDAFGYKEPVRQEPPDNPAQMLLW